MTHRSITSYWAFWVIIILAFVVVLAAQDEIAIPVNVIEFTDNGF